MRYDDSQIKGWIQLCSDMNWQDYHGLWAKKARDGSWYVLRWRNLYYAMGERGCKRDHVPRYECDVKRLDFADIAQEELDWALCWLDLRREGTSLVTSQGDLIEPPHAELATIEACIGWGLGVPLESFTGDGHPLRVRGRARRYAETIMR